MVTIRKILLMAICDVRTLSRRSWNCPFRGHSIIMPSLDMDPLYIQSLQTCVLWLVPSHLHVTNNPFETNLKLFSVIQMVSFDNIVSKNNSLIIMSSNNCLHLKLLPRKNDWLVLHLLFNYKCQTCLKFRQKIWHEISSFFVDFSIWASHPSTSISGLICFLSILIFLY